MFQSGSTGTISQEKFKLTEIKPITKTALKQGLLDASACSRSLACTLLQVIAEADVDLRGTLNLCQRWEMYHESVWRTVRLLSYLEPAGIVLHRPASLPDHDGRPP